MTLPERLLSRARKQIDDGKYIKAIGTLDALYSTGKLHQEYWSLYTPAMLGFLGYRLVRGKWVPPKKSPKRIPKRVLTPAEKKAEHHRLAVIAETAARERHAENMRLAALPVQSDAIAVSQNAIKAVKEGIHEITVAGPRLVRRICWRSVGAAQSPGPWRSWDNEVSFADAERNADGTFGPWEIATPVRLREGVASLVGHYAADAVKP